MNFAEIVAEARAHRFNANQNTYIKRWANASYQKVWNMTEWPFRTVFGAELAVTAEEPSPTVPADFARPINIWDEQGSPLTYLSAAEYAAGSRGDAGSSRPSAYAVVSRRLYLAATPSSSATYTLDYTRRVSHLDGTTQTVAPGLMVDDLDEPLWDPEHHYVLVPMTVALGIKLMNADASWQEAEAEAELLIAAMMDDYLPPDRPGTGQFGRETYE